MQLQKIFAVINEMQIVQFMEADVINQVELSDIIKRHKLSQRWARFEKQFLSDES